jgi:hypothetical protein
VSFGAVVLWRRSLTLHFELQENVGDLSSPDFEMQNMMGSPSSAYTVTPDTNRRFDSELEQRRREGFLSSRSIMHTHTPRTTTREARPSVVPYIYIYAPAPPHILCYNITAGRIANQKRKRNSKSQKTPKVKGGGGAELSRAIKISTVTALDSELSIIIIDNLPQQRGCFLSSFS